MRPINLRLRGFTSYRHQAEVDFTDLDLFAITGPTGAGKSSIMDAITYALFGQAPRVGDDVRDLVSQGEERLEVAFEFSANGGRYRVHRATGMKRAAATQLERFDEESGEWSPEEDRVGGANAYIERLLGMDYQGFTRSVLLPQGQFHQFVAGKPEERRRVLGQILRLDVYERMVRAAGDMVRGEEGRANHLAELLDGPLADATEEKLTQKKAESREVERQSARIAARRTQIGQAITLAEDLARLNGQLADVLKRQDNASRQFQAAQKLLASGKESVGRLEAQVKEAMRALAANTFDSDLPARLTGALVKAQHLEDARQRAASLAKILAEREKAAGAAEAQAKQAQQRAHAAQGERERAEEALRAAQRDNASAYLRRGLHPGDPCPVCGQPVGELPEREHAPLKQAEAAAQQAKAGEEAALRESQKAQSQLAASSQGVAGAQGQLETALADVERQESALADALAGRDMSLAGLRQELAAQQAAGKERQALEERLRTLQGDIARSAADVAAAGANLSRYQDEQELATQEAAAIGKEVEAASAALSVIAREQGWLDISEGLDRSADVRALLQRQSVDCEREGNAMQQRAGSLKNDVQRIEAGIGEARKLRDEQAAAVARARDARELGLLLRANNFQAFVREQALTVLAEDGSGHLNSLSRGRYDFSVDGQDFSIVDHWNADDARSVRTLSGGETFLASLALALALAERLPELGAASGAQAASLESLFIDEGFANLDSETLDVVASALEALGADGQRMVGVITHVPELAERMPARIVVQKSESGSSIVKV